MSNLYFILSHYSIFYRFFELLSKGDWENLREDFGYDVNTGKPIADWLLENKQDFNADEYVNELIRRIAKSIPMEKKL